ncbi:MAG: zf-HC2 domain-containing protein [Candidatus Eisenbacteria bacterium]
MMQNHPPLEELFAYRDGELDLEKRSLIEAHVLSCSACQTRLDETSDAEGMLRQGLQDPSDDYFKGLAGSVMERVAGDESPRERPGRRASLDEGPRGRAPRLPWAAILSAASAAAAVGVVVVMLVQRQDAWHGAPAPGVVGLPDQTESPKAAEGNLDEDAPVVNEAPANERALDAGDLVEAKKGDLAANKAAAPSAPPPAAGLKVEQMGAVREEEITTQSASEALPEAALQKAPGDVATRVAALRARAEAAAVGSGPSTGGAGFAEVAARHGLPLLYDPARVSGGMLLSAEPDLRVLYQTGRAGDDSARVRLYLAEAARERAAGSFDAETFDSIVHHYRRAVVLARDVETARIARKRLEDFVSRNAPGE